MVSKLASMISKWSFPTNINFGCGEIKKISNICNELNLKKPLLVTDRGIILTDIKEIICSCLLSSKINFDIFSDIDSNPSEIHLNNAIKLFKSGKHDGIIAFGGGSALDIGKLVAFMAEQILPVWDFEDIADNWKKANSQNTYPIIAIPTTSGTGSEVGRASVITNSKKLSKKIIFHPKIMPNTVICDPELTVSMPPKITVGTGLDALAHCLESFCSPYYHPMAHGIALEGMKLVINNLSQAYENPNNLEARSNMMCAALMGATAFQKGLGAIHAMSHPIGALVNSHHGTTNAVCMLPVLRLNSPVIGKYFDNVSTYLGIQGGFTGFYEFIKKLNKYFKIPKNLIELGVNKKDLEFLAKEALKDPSCSGNPVKLNYQNMYKLFEEAYQG